MMYIKVPIRTLEILYPASEAVQKSGDPAYKAVTNGSFVVGQEPLAPLFVPPGLKKNGVAVATCLQRGGVAVLDDGSIRLGRLKGEPTKLSELPGVLQQSFGRPVKAYMGGGAMLIENNVVSNSELDLHQMQHFEQKGRGIKAGQFRSTYHVLIGLNHNNPDLIVAINRSGQELIADLNPTYQELVMFDGGQQFWAHIPGQLSQYEGAHPIGLAVN